MKVEVREPYPPHAKLFEFDSGEGGAYGFKVSGEGSANFFLSRADAAVARMADVMPGRKRVGPFVTIRRADRLWTWAGWIAKYSADRAGTTYGYMARDASCILKNARAAKSGTVSGSAGNVLLAVMNEIAMRSGLPFSLERVTNGGPYIDYSPNARNGLAVLNDLAKHANYEWWFDIEVTANGVTQYLRFEERMGYDRRTDVIWNEGQQLNVGEYTQDADGYDSEVLVVGGEGSFAGRTAVTINRESNNVEQLDDVAALPTTAPLLSDGTSPILEGSNVIVSRGVTNIVALKNAGYYRADTPEEYGESLTGEVVEASTDMEAWGVGDFITVKMIDTDLGLPQVIPVRIIGVNFKPDTGLHSLVMQVRQELIQ